MNKKCRHCGKTKNTKEFNKKTANKDGFASYCRACSKEKLRKFRQENIKEYNNKSIKWYENNRDLVRERRRQAYYGITPAAFKKLLAIQNNSCAICKTPHDPSLYRNWKVLAVDHDHSCCDKTPCCGKCVRGLLCVKCNKGIGMFEDSIELLNTAIDYLRNPPKNFTTD
jgi:hypothetical protein